tara:strand:+ start:21 stop:953 length:933 start_codon:yes stop_codon:yes gene_type:complete
MISIVKQKTIKKEILIEGISLHKGNYTKIRILPAESNTGIKFIRTDIKKNNTILASWKNVTDTKMCTMLSNKNGISISTIEHLMAAISSFQIDNLLIEVNGPELPILDGSAIQYVEEFENVGIVDQNENKKFIKILKPIKYEFNKRFASVYPSKNNFKISYNINFAHPLIENEEYKINLNKNNFKNEIASARTFGFKEEHEKLKKLGLAKGASLDNCIVLNGKKILNNSGLRYKNEFLRHKILDVCGDLYLAGSSILGHFKGFQSGHYVNNQLLRKLFKNKSAYTKVNMSSEKLKEINIIAMPIPNTIAS